MSKYRYRYCKRARKPRDPKGKVRVRCLGVGPEHEFLSDDPARNRICTACKAALATVWTDQPHEYRVAASNGRGSGE